MVVTCAESGDLKEEVEEALSTLEHVKHLRVVSFLAVGFVCLEGL